MLQGRNVIPEKNRPTAAVAAESGLDASVEHRERTSVTMENGDNVDGTVPVLRGTELLQLSEQQQQQQQPQMNRPLHEEVVSAEHGDRVDAAAVTNRWSTDNSQAFPEPAVPINPMETLAERGQSTAAPSSRDRQPPTGTPRTHGDGGGDDVTLAFSATATTTASGTTSRHTEIEAVGRAGVDANGNRGERHDQPGSEKAMPEYKGGSYLCVDNGTDPVTLLQQYDRKPATGIPTVSGRIVALEGTPNKKRRARSPVSIRRLKEGQGGTTDGNTSGSSMERGYDGSASSNESENPNQQSSSGTSVSSSEEDQYVSTTGMQQQTTKTTMKKAKKQKKTNKHLKRHGKERGHRQGQGKGQGRSHQHTKGQVSSKQSKKPRHCFSSSESSSEIADFSSGASPSVHETGNLLVSPYSCSHNTSEGESEDYLQHAGPVAVKLQSGTLARRLHRPMNSSWKNTRKAKPAVVSDPNMLKHRSALQDNYNSAMRATTSRRVRNIKVTVTVPSSDSTTVAAASASLTNAPATLTTKEQSIGRMKEADSNERPRIFSLSCDTMAHCMSFLDPTEVHGLLTMPLSKDWKRHFTVPQDLWKILCLTKPFNARFDAAAVDRDYNSSGDDSASSSQSGTDMKHLLGKYRLLYTSFVRCMRYLGRIKEDAVNGRPPSIIDYGSPEIDSSSLHTNERLKSFLARARGIVMNNKRRRKHGDGDEDQQCDTSSSGEDGTNEAMTVTSSSESAAVRILMIVVGIVVVIILVATLCLVSFTPSNTIASSDQNPSCFYSILLCFPFFVYLSISNASFLSLSDVTASQQGVQEEKGQNREERQQREFYQQRQVWTFRPDSPVAWALSDRRGRQRQPTVVVCDLLNRQLDGSLRGRGGNPDNVHEGPAVPSRGREPTNDSPACRTYRHCPTEYCAVPRQRRTTYGCIPHDCAACEATRGPGGYALPLLHGELFRHLQQGITKRQERDSCDARFHEAVPSR